MILERMNEYLHLPAEAAGAQRGWNPWWESKEETKSARVSRSIVQGFSAHIVEVKKKSPLVGDDHFTSRGATLLSPGVTSK